MIAHKSHVDDTETYTRLSMYIEKNTRATLTLNISPGGIHSTNASFLHLRITCRQDEDEKGLGLSNTWPKMCELRKRVGVWAKFFFPFSLTLSSGFFCLSSTLSPYVSTRGKISCGRALFAGSTVSAHHEDPLPRGLSIHPRTFDLIGIP